METATLSENAQQSCTEIFLVTRNDVPVRAFKYQSEAERYIWGLKSAVGVHIVKVPYFGRRSP